MDSPEDRPHVVILGGGFGGLAAARTLGGAPVRVTLVDRSNHHLFQPLLYQVATALLPAPDIAAPLRNLLSSYENVRVLLAEAQRIDVDKRLVVLDHGEALTYDFLIVATGLKHDYLGHPEWERHAPGLKTLYEATPDPKVVVAVGSCAVGGGIWHDSYSIVGGVDKVLPVDVHIPGCPPRPEAIIHGVATALGLVEKQVESTEFVEQER